ncbi:MAG: hypothetical protein V7764_16925, partial [Pseudomonas marincola]|uniref:hypothetical protein n=1 Tax=Pseudomonas marincola TaxID=437900 RepID=UPI0030021FC6
MIMTKAPLANDHPTVDALRRNTKCSRRAQNIQGKAAIGMPKSQAQKSRSIERLFCLFGAGNETRTRDPDLGKVVL